MIPPFGGKRKKGQEMKKFYFTYGRGDAPMKQPYNGGWSLILAEDGAEARTIHLSKYGRSPSGFLRFAEMYSGELFQKTEMFRDNDNYGVGLREVLYEGDEPTNEAMCLLTREECMMLMRPKHDDLAETVKETTTERIAAVLGIARKNRDTTRLAMWAHEDTIAVLEAELKAREEVQA